MPKRLTAMNSLHQLAAQPRDVDHCPCRDQQCTQAKLKARGLVCRPPRDGVLVSSRHSRFVRVVRHGYQA